MQHTATSRLTAAERGAFIFAIKQCSLELAARHQLFGAMLDVVPGVAEVCQCSHFGPEDQVVPVSGRHSGRQLGTRCVGQRASR